MIHELKWIISILTYRTAQMELEFRYNFHFYIQIAMQSKIISPENGRDHVGWESVAALLDNLESQLKPKKRDFHTKTQKE
jgi:hypothetical protein